MRVALRRRRAGGVAAVGGLADAAAGLTRGAAPAGRWPSTSSCRTTRRSGAASPSAARSAGASTCRAGRRRRRSAVGEHPVAGPVHLVSVPGMARSHPYLRPDGSGWADNPARFLAFSRAVAAMVRRDPPDVAAPQRLAHRRRARRPPGAAAERADAAQRRLPGRHRRQLAAPHRPPRAALRVVGRHQPAVGRHRAGRRRRRRLARPTPGRSSPPRGRLRARRPAARPGGRGVGDPQRHRHRAVGSLRPTATSRRRSRPTEPRRRRRGPVDQPAGAAGPLRLARRRDAAGRGGLPADRPEGHRHAPADHPRAGAHPDAPDRPRRRRGADRPVAGRAGRRPPASTSRSSSATTSRWPA